MSESHPLGLKTGENGWVRRFIEVHGYERLISGKSEGGDLAANCSRHFPEDGPEAHLYVTNLINNILGRTNCGKDVAESLEWASSELIGNVFHHSQSPIGALSHFLLIKKPAKAIFSLVDCGIGILSSMRQTYPKLNDDLAAIELAVQRGITSKRENQGWGLFGSQAIVQEARGELTIWSGNGRLSLIRGEKRHAAMPYFPGTVIEWVLPLKQNLDLAKILESPNRAGSLVLERYEPILGEITLSLAQEAATFRDRPTGRHLRTKLLNLIENSGAKHCVLDFSDVGTITSSFADEFLGKTAVLFGDKFRTFVGISNISELNKAIAEIAIRARLAVETAAPDPQFIRLRSSR
jgi:hypothetical protein